MAIFSSLPQRFKCDTDTFCRETYLNLRETNMRFTLNPWQVVRPEQNFTFFVPTDEAWHKVPPNLRTQLFDGAHWDALNFVRPIIFILSLKEPMIARLVLSAICRSTSAMCCKAKR